MVKCLTCGHKFEGEECDLCGTKYSWHNLKYAKDRKEHQALADAGDVKASLRMGQYLHDQQDYKGCMPYLLTTANAGEADAQSLLGQIYYYDLIAENPRRGFCGFGSTPNIAESLKWHRMAADNGNCDSLYDMGLFYLQGEGVKKDAKTAVEYFKKAAAKWHPKSLSALGKCYLEGIGVEKDVDTAIRMHKKSAEASGYDVKSYMSWLVTSGELPISMNINKIMQIAAEEDDTLSEYVENDFFNDMKGEKNKDLQDTSMIEDDSYEELDLENMGVEDLIPLANSGNSDAQYNIGSCYYFGDEVAQDYLEAVKWLRMSAEQGNPFAQHLLGVCYHNGQGVKENKREAIKLYKMAAEQSYSYAQVYLGLCYLNGDGTKQDKHAAISWFKKAADLGDAVGQYHLGMCYGRGNGVKANSQMAIEWLRVAARQGYEDAIQVLNSIGKR